MQILKVVLYLKIKKISDNFYTQGKEIEELLSIQFVNKLIELVKTNDFEYREREVDENVKM